MSTWLQHSNLQQRLNDIKALGTSGREKIAGADFTWTATIAAGASPAINIGTDNPLSVIDDHAFICHEIRVSGEWQKAAGVAASPATTFMAWGLLSQLQFNIRGDGRKQDVLDQFKSFADIIGPDGGIVPMEFHTKFNPGEKLTLSFQLNGTWVASTVTCIVGVVMTGEYVEKRYA